MTFGFARRDEMHVPGPAVEHIPGWRSAACAEAGINSKPAAEALRVRADTAAKMYGEGVLVVVKTIGRLSDTN